MKIYILRHSHERAETTRCLKIFLPASCFRYNLFDPKPIVIIFGRDVGKGLCNVEMLAYLILSFAVGYQLKCC